ncbi:MAG: beta-galactosidase [Chloroflexi bacterium]|nr:beta-galactosidase [Chloroflexota bacterium]
MIYPDLNVSEKPQSETKRPFLPDIIYGGDYNPEQWSPETWEEDARLMQEAGVNMVSLAIFSWALLEPKPGQYDFGWLDTILDLLNKHGIKVNLATATASPPPWLAKLHPESLPVTKEGVIWWPGGRQQYCPSSPAYRDGAANLVRLIAERYQNHPALAMWHINNEYGCHVAECFCDQSARSFREWLKRRYGSIEALNGAWATAFWSQHYSEWDEINPPRSAPTYANPTQQLDFKRFSSDALLECFLMERQILKEITPDVPVTTNFLGFLKPVNYWQWSKNEDVIALDSYPDPTDEHSIMEAAMTYDLNRSMAAGKPWVIMEQVTSQVNWRPQNVLKRPGQMRLLSYQAVGRGANGIMFFQWRQSRAGAEKYHGAMVPHIGTTNSRVWREVTALGAELNSLSKIKDSSHKNEVAIVFDWESWWALELDSKPSADIKMMDQLKSYYETLFKQNVNIDFVRPDSDLTPYKVVLLPNLYMVSEENARNIESYVAGGGHVVMSFFSGIVNENEHIYLGGYGAPFRKMLGLQVQEFDPYRPGQTNRLCLDQDTDNPEAEGWLFDCNLWSDLIHLEGAETLARYEQDFYKTQPALTRHHFGKGVAYYLGTHAEPAFMDWLLAKVTREAGVTPAPNVPGGVEVTTRRNEDAAYRFFLNHNSHSIEIKLDTPARDVLTNTLYIESFILEGYGVAILTQPPTPGEK